MYWVLPGGRAEPSDASLEAALHREIHEEIAGRAEVVRLLFTTESAGERSNYYLARVDTWDFEARTGPEFDNPANGSYALDEVPVTVDALDCLNLKPDEFAGFLRQAIADGALGAV